MATPCDEQKVARVLCPIEARGERQTRARLRGGVHSHGARRWPRRARAKSAVAESDSCVGKRCQMDLFNGDDAR